jgi:hypothetical protein
MTYPSVRELKLEHYEGGHKREIVEVAWLLGVSAGGVILVVVATPLSIREYRDTSGHFPQFRSLIQIRHSPAR